MSNSRSQETSGDFSDPQQTTETPAQVVNESSQITVHQVPETEDLSSLEDGGACPVKTHPLQSQPQLQGREEEPGPLEHRYNLPPQVMQPPGPLPRNWRTPRRTGTKRKFNSEAHIKGIGVNPLEESHVGAES